MTRSVGRSTWTTETIRAIDLTEQDTVLVGGIWREIFDVWKDSDDPAALFGEGEPTTVALLAKIDWSSPCWVGIRYVDEDRSTPGEIEDALHFFRLRELVQVQKELPCMPFSDTGTTVPAPQEQEAGPSMTRSVYAAAYAPPAGNRQQ